VSYLFILCALALELKSASNVNIELPLTTCPRFFIALARSASLLACQPCSSSSQRRSSFCLLVRIPGGFAFCEGNPLNIDNTGFLNQKVNIIKIGGFCGIATAVIAYYCGLAEMLTDNDLFTLPTGKHT
jgi:hypothetical protein